VREIKPWSPYQASAPATEEEEEGSGDDEEDGGSSSGDAPQFDTDGHYIEPEEEADDEPEEEADEVVS
jgi:hypothetical protein